MATVAWVHQLQEIAAVRPALAVQIQAAADQLERAGLRSSADQLRGLAPTAEALEERHFYEALRAEQLMLTNHTDEITGGLNEVGLAHHLRTTLARVAFREQHRVALVYLDLSGFKAINDTYGHDMGDRVLDATNARLKGAIRSPGTVGRVGGNRFVAAVIADNDAVLEDIVKRFERVLAEPLRMMDGTTLPGWGFAHGAVTISAPHDFAADRTLDEFHTYADRLSSADLRNEARRTMLEAKGVDPQRIESIVDSIDPLVPRGLDEGTEEWRATIAQLDETSRTLGRELSTIATDVMRRNHRQNEKLATMVGALAQDANERAVRQLADEYHRQVLEVALIHDELTGHYNKRGFDRHVSEVIAPIAMRDSLTVALTYADISGLGNLNQIYGAATVDSVLREVHDRIDRVLKNPAVVGRLHGDEFVIATLVSGESGSRRDEISTIEARIRATLDQPFSVPDGMPPLNGVGIKLGTVPIGPPTFVAGIEPAAQVAAFADEILDPGNAKAADILMYRDGENNDSLQPPTEQGKQGWSK